MSIQAIAWVLENSEALAAHRLVLLAIANHADASGWNAYPSVPSIAHEARVDRATVFRAIAALEESGELVVRRVAGRSNRYGIAALMGSQDATGKAKVEGSQDATGGVASRHYRGRTMRPEPSLTVNEPSRARACRVCGAPAPPGDGRCRPCADDGRELPRKPPTDTSPIPSGPVRLPSSLDKDTRARGAEYFRNLRLRKDDALAEPTQIRREGRP